MALDNKTLHQWYNEFRHLLSGWTIKEQIQFHEYCLLLLKQKAKTTSKKEVEL